jgi:hypothetical protein
MYEAQDKMEFTCGNYDVQLTLNPTDMILRLEHCENKRLYERTFYERDFAEVIVLGGLEFVGKVVVAKITTATFAETTSEVNFTLTFTHELLPKPLTLTFQVPAVKREKASADMEGLLARLKKMESALILCKELSSRVKELEQRCGDTITLPGCDYTIPVNVTNLILVRNGGMLPNGNTFSSLYPGYYYQCNHNQSGFSESMPFNQSYGWTKVNKDVHVFVFNELFDIDNLKYCKNLKCLTICGSSELSDYSTIGKLNLIENLTIVACSHSTPTCHYAAKNHHPPLTDISWISNLTKLEKVSFRGCSNLTDIGILKLLNNLKEVDICETGVKNCSFLGSSVNVTKV